MTVSVLSDARPQDFLAPGEYVDYQHPKIAELAQQLNAQSDDAEDYARQAFAWCI